LTLINLKLTLCFCDVKWDLLKYFPGGPGSGKGTQTTKIAHRYDFEHVSVGEILRNQLLHHAPSDRKWELIAQIIANGELAPQVWKCDHQTM